MNSTNLSKKQVDDMTGSLLLMIVFTAIWVIIAESVIAGRDYGLITIVLGAVIIYLVVNYGRLSKLSHSLPTGQVDTEAEKAKTKKFYIILAVEGIAIFVVKNVLVNTGHNNLFFPCFALIVGLHFFPLAKLFNRSFYYAVGVWICLVAITGFMLTGMKLPVYLPVAIIGIGCALGTAANGVRIVWEGNKP
jgi:hypothetical protein